MEQLSSLDQQFLAVESATNTGHIAGVYLLDPPADGGPLRLADLRNLVAARIDRAPALRRKLVEVPFGLDRPYWIAADLNLDAHLHSHELAGPGDERALTALVAQLHARPLNRSRPLWELHLINGRRDGGPAVYAKVHHAAVDGISAGAVLGLLLDREPRRPPAAAPTPTPGEAPPHAGRLLGRGLRNICAHPGRAMRSVPRLLPHLDDLPGADRVPGSRAVADVAARVARLGNRPTGRTGLPERRRLRVPPTPFNAPVGAERAVAFASVPVRDVRVVRNSYGCTDNDVVLALCATVLRGWLFEQGALPARPLVVGVPVSLRKRSPNGTEAAGNQISLVVAPLPTHVDDPVLRLRAVATAMLIAKRRLAAMPEGWLTDVTDLVPAAFTGITTRSIGKVLHGARRHPVNLVISSVPGPHVPLYLAGARMVAHYPVSAVSDALGGLNITVVGHDGDLDFGFVACPRLVPDLWALATAVPAALDELLRAAPVATP
ncbi:MAG TPA: wax ester/triacylglycerol synthase family O-acyltransferase [Sporichthyaceae bacterium]|jgi:WS/DGAT/MGAT family acyltransferase|nr:wax ester/triacylglycerol synthase family O-acyltransferase [Sporichthyaceae bacterium]